MAPNIRVNCLVPGGVHFNQTKQFIKNYSKLTPMKRMMKSGELNLIVDYLSSDNLGYAGIDLFDIN